VDTPSARCQEAVLTLALLYQIPGTAYVGSESLLAWVNAGTRFWRTLQRPDGSFDEWYPHEHSFVATAFSGYAVSEAALLLGAALECRQEVERSLLKAGHWLLRNQERRALNQVSGCALALYNVFLVTGDRRFEKGAFDKIGFLQRSRSPEGWFAEYGGADVGYLSLTVAYLAKLYRKSQWPAVLELALGAIAFLKGFLHRNLTSGGTYGSRLTTYLLPDGFEILASRSTSALTVSQFIREALRREESVSLASFDDRYVSYVSYNFLEAFLYGAASSEGFAGVSERSSNTPPVCHSDQYFPEAGLVVIRQDQCEGVVNVRRGGAFKFVFEGGTSMSDSGAIVVDQQGWAFYSGFWDDTATSRVEGRQMSVRGCLQRAQDLPLRPWRSMLFRFVQMTVGKNDRLALWVKNVLRNLLIMPKGNSGMQYERNIAFTEGSLVIRDRLRDVSGRLHVDKILLGSSASFLYTPSSKYFTTSDLAEQPAVALVPKPQHGHGIEITRQYNLRGQLQALTMDERA
jgi:hypothetical protein